MLRFSICFNIVKLIAKIKSFSIPILVLSKSGNFLENDQAVAKITIPWSHLHQLLPRSCLYLLSSLIPPLPPRPELSPMVISSLLQFTYMNTNYATRRSIMLIMSGEKNIENLLFLIFRDCWTNNLFVL